MPSQGINHNPIAMRKKITYPYRTHIPAKNCKIVQIDADNARAFLISIEVII